MVKIGNNVHIVKTDKRIKTKGLYAMDLNICGTL